MGKIWRVPFDYFSVDRRYWAFRMHTPVKNIVVKILSLPANSLAVSTSSLAGVPAALRGPYDIDPLRTPWGSKPIIKQTVVFLLSLAVFVLGGCASMQPLSNYARTGDTVAISLGGTESNALVPVLKKQNVSISITDAGGNIYPVKLRNIIRIYSDPTSQYEFDNLTANQNYSIYTRPHQGLWIAIVDLVDPVSDQPHALAVGQASLSVSSPDIQNWVDYPGYGWNWTNGNLANIPLEILAGTGSANPLNYLAPVSYSSIRALESAEQIDVRAAGSPSNEIGGGTFVLQYTNNSFQHPPRVTTTSPDRNVQLSWSRQDQGNGTSLLTVVMINPHGFSMTNGRNGITFAQGNGGKSLFDDLRFSVFWNGELVNIDDTNWQSHVDIVSAQFSDVNGLPMPELSATAVKAK